ncbi:MAG: LysM peptidoglycan-binding domain-containing protein [Myxococcales bacterium]|nr:LysM peptidoglycan-binding domain-containing protein [Myxococcales bacterium]MCB9737209.1 LysM peptidoglycan-binding domain-containing protein [Deltaproteobacteria bacterium]
MGIGAGLNKAVAFKDIAQSNLTGSLAKAKFMVYETKDLDGFLDEIDFFLNPSSIVVKRSATFEEEKQNQATTQTAYKGTDPISLELGELWFDTYDSRENVRETYIDRLEKLVQYVPGTHYLPAVTLVWGQFTHSTIFAPEYVFYMKDLNVTYSMFLPDATPVRAKVSVCLTQIATVTFEDMFRQKQSPDHAKFVTVRRGDTLQGIAHREYRNPREWRRIAESNGLHDPLNLKPGTRLLVPPIL